MESRSGHEAKRRLLGSPQLAEVLSLRDQLSGTTAWFQMSGRQLPRLKHEAEARGLQKAGCYG